MAEYSNQVQVNGTSYLTQDTLGSTRAVTDKDGVVKSRHDYFPFGEELYAGTGGRTTAQGYGQFDNLRQHFTGKERDEEIRLDYSLARSYTYTMGRFVSPDPLLNSGHPDNPQTWNRFTYTLNNPSKFVDPTGLYNLVNTCGSGDNKCNKKFDEYAEKLKKGLTTLSEKLKNVTDPGQKARLEASLKTLGTENDKNNVYVKFDSTPGRGAGHTELIVNDKTGSIEGVSITFNPEKTRSSDDFAINAAHEGTHATDLLDPRYAQSANSGGLSDFSSEYRAYQTSVWAASALGWSSYSMKDGAYKIWNKSWGAIDDKVLTKYITEQYKYGNGKPYKETTPHNPWPD